MIGKGESLLGMMCPSGQGDPSQDREVMSSQESVRLSILPSSVNRYPEYSF